MNAADVWLAHLREQAVEAQRKAGTWGRMSAAAASECAGLPTHAGPGVDKRRALLGAQQAARQLGIIAREARRQYQAAVALMADPSWRKMMGVARGNPRAAQMGAVGMEGVLLGLVGHEP